MDDLPLADVRVIDVTVARAGPTCVRQLADWGADVIRVEEPTEAEEHRWGSDFQNLHRNKRCVAIDLKQADGAALLLRLARSADVLVENMRPAVKDRLGFGFATVHAHNPRLVYGSISGFGQTGPYAERGGVDQIAQGMGGLMSVTGQPGTDPTRVGIPVADLAAGLHLAIGILVALHERERTGVGRWVHTSLLESMIAMMDFQAVRWTVDGVVAAQEGNHHPTQVPMGCFPTADGYVNVAGPHGRLLDRFCEVVGLPELPSDPRFDSPGKRSANRAELNRLIGERLATRTTGVWVETLNQAGVPCGPVLRTDEVFADPQVSHLGMVATVQSPALGPLRILRNAVTIAGGPDTVRAPSPQSGEHTTEVLEELGLDAEEIKDLRERHVIASHREGQ
jgi:crotonobetainyl-CoA:carnitine CoA-transferase CaiB-like acyl-CoA transferase